MASHLRIILLLTFVATLAYSFPSEVTPEETIAPISFEEYRQTLVQNPFQYDYAIGAMADGDELYCLKGELSTECRATLMAFSKMSLNWTSYPDVQLQLNMNRLKNMTELGHPLESVCPLVEELIEKMSKIVDDFRRLKEALIKSATVAKPKKCYFRTLLRNFQEFEAQTSKLHRIPGLAKLLANEEFRKQRYPQAAYRRDTHIVAKSVETLANKGEYRAPVQQIYDDVIAETSKLIGNITSMRDIILKDPNSHTHTFTFIPSMMQMLQKRIEDDAVLKPEFENAKKLVTATLTK